MKKNYIFAAAAAAIILIAVAVIGLIIYKDYKEKHAPSEVVMPLDEYYAISGEDVMIIIDEKVYDKKALWRNDAVYLDLDTVQQMYDTDRKFFWAEAENTLYYDVPGIVFRFFPGKSEYYINRGETAADRPMAELKDGVVYICLDLLKQYSGITYSIYDDPHRLLITYSDEAFLTAPASENTQIRVSQSIKADILKEVKAGDTLRFIDGGGIREEGFIKVMSTDGVRGYIKESALEESNYTDPVFAEYKAPEYSFTRLDHRIYLGWQLLYTANNVDLLEEAIAKAPEMNVISPTWFFLSDTDGNMIDYANADYVRIAHSKGLQVWALYKNDTIEGKFTCSEDSHTVLASYESRTRLIDNMIASVEKYGIDGINIDFEMLKVDTGVYFIEFLKELSIECHARGIILSVDNYVPENYNAYYNLSEQADVVDYIIIMGYDEHYAGSEEAGSVASLGWFKRAIANTVAKCDPAGIIMGVPFYTRLWKENGGKITVEATPVMAEAASLVKKAGVEPEWDEECGPYYAEWTNSGLYRIWLEEEESIRAKVLASREAGVAGIAAWKVGDEKAGTWTAIVDAMEGELPTADETGDGTDE